MIDASAAAVSQPGVNMDSELRNRLHELARGNHSEAEFVGEISSLVRAAPDSAGNALVAINQQFIRGEISADDFRAKASKIIGRGTATMPYVATLDLRTRPAEQTADSHDDSSPFAGIEIGRVLRDRYVLEKRLGSGGMGTVFKALDRYRADLPPANQYVAIKILHEKSDNREELLANLRREFYCTQRLSHRNIVKVYELDRDGELDFFTMELLEGDLLSSVTERLHPLPMPRPYAWAIIREIGAGLAHAHARNVVHGDLKPHNVMITQSGEVRILDFGASSTATTQGADAPVRRTTTSALTPAYACCELLAGRSADPRDDIYAFACLSYELLAGAHPFQRRPSTVARDLGIVPDRPPGLSAQQWKTLTMGLSWHRGGRSILVRTWLDRLSAERAAAKQLPRARDIEPAPAPARPLASFKAATAFAVLLITVSVWLSLVRVAPAGKSRDNGGPTLAANSRSSFGTDAKAPADFGPMQASLGDTGPFDTLPELPVAASLPDTTKREAMRPKPATLLNPIVVAARTYRIHSGENFAEIRVHRSSQQLRGDTAFVWWTEAASAKPGIDYVQQGKVTQLIPRGKNSTSFFIKLLPTASRSQDEMFYIAIAGTGSGGAPGRVERAAVWLPPTHNHS
ncbi:MAG: serine/threonine-protein kinase [Steroidobacteraceae bacterium]